MREAFVVITFKDIASKEKTEKLSFRIVPKEPTNEHKLKLGKHTEEVTALVILL